MKVVWVEGGSWKILGVKSESFIPIKNCRQSPSRRTETRRHTDGIDLLGFTSWPHALCNQFASGRSRCCARQWCQSVVSDTANVEASHSTTGAGVASVTRGCGAMRSSTEACASACRGKRKSDVVNHESRRCAGHGRHWSDNRAKEQDDRAAGFNRGRFVTDTRCSTLRNRCKDPHHNCDAGQKQSLPQCFHAKHLHLLHPRSATFSSDQTNHLSRRRVPAFAVSSFLFSPRTPHPPPRSRPPTWLACIPTSSHTEKKFAVRNITQCIIQTSSAKST